MNPLNSGVGSRICKLFGKVLLPLVLITLLGSTAWAQSTFGSIVGTVKDSSGSVIPGAKVTLTNTGTSEARNMQTDSSGSYQFVNLQPGVYQLSIERDGFKRKVLAGMLFMLPGILSDLIALVLLALPINVGREFAPHTVGPGRYPASRKAIDGEYHRVD